MFAMCSEIFRGEAPQQGKALLLFYLSKDKEPQTEIKH